jgi:hypothetical protein
MASLPNFSCVFLSNVELGIPDDRDHRFRAIVIADSGVIVITFIAITGTVITMPRNDFHRQGWRWTSQKAS